MTISFFRKKALVAALAAWGCGIGAWAQTDILRLLFAGDVMGHAPQIKSAEVAPGKWDYAPCFQYVAPLIERADLAIANLEVTLPGKPPYQGYPMFRSPDQLAYDLRNAGFDILVTANNHSNDSHGPGLIHTIETLRNAGFQHTGTFLNPRDRQAYYPLMVYAKGFKLAILNYTYDTNGVPTDPPAIVNLIDTALMAADLYEARARKPHYIIAVMHWGLEYQLVENTEQRRLARFLIRNGADMVIGSHPHVVQPMRLERVEMPDGGVKEALVVYSLGNFISNQQKPHTDGGIVYQVELLKDRGRPEVRLGRHGYTPVWRYIHKDPVSGKTTYYALPIANDADSPLPPMPAASKAAIIRWGRELRNRIGERYAW